MRTPVTVRSLASWLTSVAVVAVLACVAVVVPTSPAIAAPVNGTALLNESFNGATVSNPGIRALNDACLTGSTTQPPATDPSVSNLGKCVKTVSSPNPGKTPGFLQLTDAENDSRGGIVYNRALPGNAGIQIEFQQFQYGGTKADGINFFLVDGAVNLDGVGAYGGSLGYAQKNSTQGVNGGYLGVGLDVYGNYANDSENRGNGCATASPVKGSTLIKNSVVIRGPQQTGDTTRLKGYCYLAGTVNSAGTATTLPGSLHGESSDPESNRRDVRITVSEDPLPTVTVEIDFLDGKGYQNVLNYKMKTPAPATYKFGLAASTGSQNDVHLIRTVKVQTVVPLPAINLVKQVDKTQQQPASYTAGDTIPYQFVVTNADTAPLSNVAVTDPLVSKISCPRTTLDAAGTVNASMTCTGSYTLQPTDVDTETTFTNTALAKAVNSDGQTVQATSTVTVPITAKPAIAIDKSATLDDTNGNGTADVGENVAYQFHVTNTGNRRLTSMVVNDSKVASVSCPQTTLAALADMTCTATYTVTQADIDAGAVRNSATATGTPPTGSAVTSPPSTTSVPVAKQAPAIALSKQADLQDSNGNGSADLGETIAYSFVASNPGNVTLTGLTVTDAKAGTVTCPVTTLAPGASTTCTARPYKVTQADVDAGVVRNSAIARAKPPTGAEIPSVPATTTTPVISPSPLLTIDKTATPDDANGNGLVEVGETIAYTFLVSNKGNVTVTGVRVTDLKAGIGTITCVATTLVPGATTTCAAAPVYVVTQADVDDGEVQNAATARGLDPGGSAVASEPDVAIVPAQKQAPQLTIAKTARLTDTNGDGLAQVGERITYTFLVTNTGNVAMTAIAVADSRIAAVTCPAGPLAPRASVTCTAPAYVVTQADVDDGVVENSATASGLAPGATTPTVSDPSTADVPAEKPAPSLSLRKTASLDDASDPPNNLADVGETITYSFVVTNTGNVTMRAVGVLDTKAGAVTCPATVLAPDASTTCTAAPYTVTQADVDSGAVTNSATASGRPPSGDTVTSAPDTTSTPTAVPNPSLAIVKRAALVDRAGGTTREAEAGERIGYTFTVTNTGNVTIDGIAVTDAKAGAVTCAATTLAPQASTTCRADDAYIVTQADVDAGVVHNSAVATGTAPDGDPTTSPPDSTDTPTATPAPVLTLTKRAVLDDTNDNGVADVGETIAYSFEAANVGNVTLTGVAVTDAKAGPVTCAPTTLAPDATADCRADDDYTVTQADVDAGIVHNEATAQGNPPGTAGPITSNVAQSEVPVPAANPSLGLVKSAELPAGANVADVGDEIDYTFIVTNTGNVTLDTVQVDDPTAGSVTCPTGPLAPGASRTCATDDPYVVTQDDVDGGTIRNVATATGTPPTGDDVTSPPAESEVPTVQASPSLSLTKSAVLDDTDGNGTADVGETIAYRFVVTNNGNVTLHGLDVDDPRAGDVTCDPATPLEPGDQATCTADDPYRVTQADVDAGSVANVATASGLPPTGPSVTSNEARAEIGTTPAAPGLALSKSAILDDTNDNGTADAGETVAYAFVVTNTGNVSIHTITIDDAFVGDVTCPTTPLEPGDTARCEADEDHIVTQAEVDSGVLTNTATATGTAPGGEVESNPSTVEVSTTPPAPGIVIQKAAALDDANDNGLGDVGESIAYSFTVINTGNVTLAQVAVDDPAAGPVTCDTRTLTPGAETTCAADDAYVITQADVDRGVVVNIATATGNPPGTTGPVTSPPSEKQVPTVHAAPGLHVEKASTLDDTNGNGTADAGETIAYTFTVTNTGNVSIGDVAVDDPTAGTVTCQPTTLAPTEQAVCAADDPYTVTQADVDHGYVHNVATATGTPPGGGTTTSPETEHNVPATPPVPGLALTKDGALADRDLDLLASVGDSIAYSFVATNTGNVTLTNVTVDDPTLGAVTCLTTTLTPGESTDCHALVLRNVTQADVDRGRLVNTATATGTPPGGGDTTSPPASLVITTVDQQPGLVVTKDGTLVENPETTDGLADVGEQVLYTFSVTNTGNVTITGITVDDALAGPVTCSLTTLAPAATTDCSADAPYTVTQADVDAGSVRNVATASGTPPGGGSTDSPPGRDIVPTVQPDAHLVVSKAAQLQPDPNGLADRGSEIDYSFTVTNTGNVTLSDITIVDPKVGAATCEATSLLPQESTTCVADNPYIVTLADVDDGVVRNVATATGTPPGGDPVTSPESETNTPTVDRVPGVGLSKKAVLNDTNGNGLADLGETVAWTFVVTNTGNVTLRTIAVIDPRAGAVTCDLATLTPGDVATCAADLPHPVDQADIDHGSVDNVATASGVPPGGGTTVSQPARDTVPTTLRIPALFLVKTAQLIDANDNGWADLGETVRYSFTITNIGNVTMTDVDLTDSNLAGVTCSATTLAPSTTVLRAGEGDVATCGPRDHTVTQHDIDVGFVHNQAVATGQPPTGVRVPSQPATTDVPSLERVPALTIVKKAVLDDTNGNDLADVGETIDYTFVVRNSGNVTLHDVGVRDPKAGPVTCPTTELAPFGDDISMTCQAAPYTVTEADVDAGWVRNSATAHGIGPNGVSVVSRPSKTATATVSVGELIMTKTASATHVTPGSPVRFTITMTNTGQSTRAASFSDDLSDVLDDAAWNDDATASTGVLTVDLPELRWGGDLGPGQKVTVTYSVTVADEPGDAGADVQEAVVPSSTTAGNAVLTNTVSSDVGMCATDRSPDCTTETGVAPDAIGPPVGPGGPGGGELPDTGAGDLGLLLATGSALLAVGGVLAIRRRRRGPAKAA